MITLKSESNRIANLLKQPNNHELKERIKDSYKNLIAKYIRQSFDKHGIDDSVLLTFESELIDTKYPNSRNPDSTFNKIGLEVKRTKHKIPSTIRFNNITPYVNVSDGYNSYTFVHSREFVKHSSSFSIGQVFTYIIEDNYIFCKSNDETFKLKTKDIRVTAPFENPEQVLMFYDNENDGQDIILPIPRDIAAIITNDLLKSEFGVIPTPEEVKVELNERPT